MRSLGGERYFYAYTKRSPLEVQKSKYTPERCRITTINTATSDRPLTIPETRKLLGIHTRHTVNEHLKALGLFGSSSLSWDEFKLLLAIRLWTQIKPGNQTFSRAKFTRCLEAQIQPEQLLLRFNINLNQQFEDIKHEYQKRQRNAAA